MRTIKFLLLFLCAPAFAQTHVKFSLSDTQFRITNTTNRVVVVQASSGPYGSRGSVLLPFQMRSRTDTNGSCTFSNLYGGSNIFYRVIIPAPPERADFDIYVSSTNLGLVNASDLLAFPTGSSNAMTYASYSFSNTNANAGAVFVDGWKIYIGTNSTGGSSTLDTNLFVTTNTLATATAGLLSTNLGITLGTNYGFALVTDYSHFTNSTAGQTNVRGEFTYAGLLSGLSYWTNHNAQSLLISNGYTTNSVAYWAYTTNNGTVPGTNFTMVYYYHTNPTNDGTPGTAFNWVKVAASGAALPNKGVAWDQIIIPTNEYPQVVFGTPILSPHDSSNTTYSVESWGSDNVGRVGYFPFKTLKAAVDYPTNIATNIVIGTGSFTNRYDYYTMPVLRSGMTLKGQGVGLTTLGVASASTNPATGDFSQAFSVAGNNVIRDMRILSVISPTNGASAVVSNVTFIDCEWGDTNAIDCWFGDGRAYGMVFERVKFISQWDTTKGISDAIYRDCTFELYGQHQTTNNYSIIAGVHGLNVSNVVIVGGSVTIFGAPQPGVGTWAGGLTNSCIAVDYPNADIKIYGTRFTYPTNTLFIYDTYSSTNVNGYWWQNGDLVVAVSGTFYTNKLTTLTATTATLGSATVTGTLTGTNAALSSPTFSTNASSANVSANFGGGHVTNANFVYAANFVSGANGFSSGGLYIGGYQTIPAVGVLRNNSGDVSLRTGSTDTFWSGLAGFRSNTNGVVGGSLTVSNGITALGTNTLGGATTVSNLTVPGAITMGSSNIVFRASTLGGTNGLYFINPTSGNTNWILLQ